MKVARAAILPTALIRIIVRQQLNCALENGNDLRSWTVDQILEDLNRYSAECEGLTPDEMRLHVEEWRREQLQ